MRNKVGNSNIIMLTIIILFVLFTIIRGFITVKANSDNKYTKTFLSIEIEEGDTLSSIAIEYAPSPALYDSYIDEVRAINNLKSDIIHSGCYLLIPVYSQDNNFN